MTVVRTTLSRLDVSGSTTASLDDVATVLGTVSSDIVSGCGHERVGDAFADVLVAGADPSMGLGPAGRAASELILSGLCRAITDDGIALPPRGRAACVGTTPATTATTTATTTAWVTLPPVSSGIPEDSIEYVVQRGDTPAAIGERAGGWCTGAEILAFNPDLDVDRDFVPGRTIRLPVSCLGDGVTEESLNDSNGSDEETPGSTVVGGNSYTVVRGDFPFKIVEKTGCSYEELKAANGRRFTNPEPGTQLVVPTECDTRDEP